MILRCKLLVKVLTNTAATVQCGGIGRIFKISCRHLIFWDIFGVIMNVDGGNQAAVRRAEWPAFYTPPGGW